MALKDASFKAPLPTTKKIVSLSERFFHRRHKQRVRYMIQRQFAITKSDDQAKMSTAKFSTQEVTELLATNLFVMRKIYDKNNSVLMKCLWTVIVILCFMLTVAQISDRISYFLSEPVSVSVQIERNTSMEFPQITMCNKNPFRASAIRQLKQELAQRRRVSAEDVTINDLLDEYGVIFMWKETGYNIPAKIMDCYIYRTELCTKYGNWTPIFTVLGLCYTYRFESSMYAAGPYQSFFLVMDHDDELTMAAKGWKLLIHYAEEYPGLTVRTEALTLYPNMRTDVVVELRKFHTVNTWAKPCSSDPKYQASVCLANCLFHFIAVNVSCRLPNMDLDEYPMCNTSKLHNIAYALHEENLSEEGTWNARECQCPRQCRENIFSTKVDIRWWPNDNQTIVRVYYEDLTYESVEETRTYGVVSLLSDTGGILGLFMGACVLTIFEVIEVLFFVVRNKLFNR